MSGSMWRRFRTTGRTAKSLETPKVVAAVTKPSALRAAYEEAALGSRAPSHAMTTGAVLNAHLGVIKYEPNRVYMVSASGVTPVE